MRTATFANLVPTVQDHSLTPPTLHHHQQSSPPTTDLLCVATFQRMERSTHLVIQEPISHLSGPPIAFHARLAHSARTQRWEGSQAQTTCAQLATLAPLGRRPTLTLLSAPQATSQPRDSRAAPSALTVSTQTRARPRAPLVQPGTSAIAIALIPSLAFNLRSAAGANQ